MSLSNPLQRDRVVRCAYWEGGDFTEVFQAGADL
jgi:hypothetical protein